MKFITPELAQGHSEATKRGAIEGTIGSSIAAIGGSYWLHKRYPGYRALPLSLKALGVVIVVAPVLTIQAERRGYQYDREHWEGEAKRMIDVKELAEEQRWENLSTRDRIAEWADKHQYSLILGGWASSLAFAGAIIQRDRLQTTAQKIVQARMWAQGLTIGLLIVAGALTQSKKFKNQDRVQSDHSWRDILEQQERERQDLERQRIEAGRAALPASA